MNGKMSWKCMRFEARNLCSVFERGIKKRLNLDTDSYFENYVSVKSSKQFQRNHTIIYVGS